MFVNLSKDLVGFYQWNDTINSESVCSVLTARKIMGCPQQLDCHDTLSGMLMKQTINNDDWQDFQGLNVTN